MSIWEKNAREAYEIHGCYVDWEDRFYECPCCGEPVYECDWPDKTLENFLCPICEDEDLEEE